MAKTRTGRRILVAVTALMLAGRLSSTYSLAQPTSEELSVIADYLEANDVQGLRGYLKAHPELIEGNTSLAVLLRRFFIESAAPNNFFKFDPNLSDTVTGQQQPSLGTGSPIAPSY